MTLEIQPNPCQPSLAESRILVTGGAGFIGSHLVEALLATGAEVRVLDDFSTGHRERLPQHAPRLEILEGDLRDPSTCERAVAGVEHVCHLAAKISVAESLERPEETMAVNVTGSRQLFEAARAAGVQRVVYASSASVYGLDAEQPCLEGREGRLANPYAESKARLEALARIASTESGLVTVGLRYFNVYGPRQNPAGDYASVVPRFLAAMQRGEPLTLYGNGEQSRDFIYVRDVVRANLLACSVPLFGASVFNVGSGKATSVRALAALISPIVAFAPERPSDVLHSCADVTRARDKLAFSAETPLAEGLRLTAESHGTSLART